MEPRKRSTRASLGNSVGTPPSQKTQEAAAVAAAAPPQQKTPAHALPDRLPSSLDPLLNPSPLVSNGRRARSIGSATGDAPVAGAAAATGNDSLLTPSSPIARGSSAATTVARPTGPQRSTSRSVPLSPPVVEPSPRFPAPMVEPLAFGGRRLALAGSSTATSADAPPTAVHPPIRPLRALPDSQHSSLDTSPLHPHSSSSTAVEPASSSAAILAVAATGSYNSAQAAREQQQQAASSSKAGSTKLSSSASGSTSSAKVGASQRVGSAGATAGSSASATAPPTKKKKKAPSAEPAPLAKADADVDTADGSSGVLQAGDLSLEFKTIDGVQMVLGKEGKWFDFNPGPNGTGKVDGDVVFECFICDKTYLGLHARSIWRRHLKDKHKIPLSLQPRRTRWDDREDQPDDKKRKKSSGVKRPSKPRKEGSKAGPSSASSTGGGGYSDSAADLSQDDAGESESEIEGITSSGGGVRPRVGGKGKGRGKGKGVRGRMASPPATIVEELAESAHHAGGSSGRISPVVVTYDDEDDEGDRASHPDDDSRFYNPPTDGSNHGGFHQHHQDQPYFYPPATYGQLFPPPGHVQQYAYPQAATSAHHGGGYPSMAYPPPPAIGGHLTSYPPYAYATHGEQQYSYPLSAYGSANGGGSASSFARDEPLDTERSHSPVVAGFGEQHLTHERGSGQPFYADQPPTHGRTIYRRSSFPSSLRGHHAHLLAPELVSPARSASAAPESPSRPRHGRPPAGEDAGDAAELLMQLKQSSPLKPNPDDDLAISSDSDDGARRESSARINNGNRSTLLPAHDLLPAVDLLDATLSRRSRSVSRMPLENEEVGSPGVSGDASPRLVGRRKDESRSLAYGPSGDNSLRTHLLRSPAFPHPSSPFQPPSSSPVIGRNGSSTQARIEGSSSAAALRDSFVTPYGKFAARRTTFRPQVMQTPVGPAAGDEGASPRENNAAAETDVFADPRALDRRRSPAGHLLPSSPAFQTTNDSPRPTKEVEEQAASRRRDSTPLVPLFAQPQVPQRRSITATTPLISSLTRTTLPAWHPTPLKSSSTMTALDYTPVVSSTRTPFKSSSGSKSATVEGDDRIAPLKSIRYTPGAFGAHLGSTPREAPSLSNGSSPPQSSLSVLSSPQSLGLTRSLGLAPATPGGQWDHLHSNTFGTPDDNLLIGSLKKRRGSWAVGAKAQSSSSTLAGATVVAAAGGDGKERPRKKPRASLDSAVTGSRTDSGFFDDIKETPAAELTTLSDVQPPSAQTGPDSRTVTAAAAVADRLAKDTSAPVVLA